MEPIAEPTTETMTTEQTNDVATEEPTYMSVVDRLTLQLEFVNINNLQLQLRILRGDLLQAETAATAQINKYRKLQQDLAAKYGIDLACTTIDDNGKFIPLTPEMRQALAANTPMRF